MKLFDRSVDLAQFSETTPLYPVCRAWMKNQPLNRNLGITERIPTPKPEIFGLGEDVSVKKLNMLDGLRFCSLYVQNCSTHALTFQS